MEHEKENSDLLHAQKGTRGGNVPTETETPSAGQESAKKQVFLPSIPPRVIAVDHPSTELPPCDINAEKSVIGGILLDGADGERTGEVFDLLDTLDFYSDPYRTMYRVLRALYLDQSPTNDAVLFRSAVRTQKLEQDCGGDTLLLETMDYVPTAANLLHYAKIVAGKAVIRRTREAAATITGLTHDGRKTAEEIADEAETLLLGATAGAGGAAGTWVSAGDANDGLLEELLKRAKGETKNIKSGLAGVDRIIPSFVAGSLHILAARPACGKTAAALTIGDLVAERGKKVALFSMEMTQTDVAERRLAKYAQINSRKFKDPRFTKSEQEAIREATERIRTLPFFCDDEGTLTVRSMRSRLRRLRASMGGLDFVIIDYIQLASGESARAMKDKRNEVMEVTRGLKNLAKEFDVPILALAQLNRECEKREDKRPMLSDLAESGQIENDAWTISFLYRASKYAPPDSQPLRADAQDEVEWIVAKNRDGLERSVTLGFRLPFTQFVDLDEERGTF